jgi:stage V sporulation protein K
MPNDKLEVLQQSFHDLIEDIEQSLKVENEATIQYHLLRAYRIRTRVDEFLGQHPKGNFIHLKTQIEQKLCQWHIWLATIYEQDYEMERAEKEILTALQYNFEVPDHYFQYAHTTLRKHFLKVDRDIDENMDYISKANVFEVMGALRRAKFAVRVAESEGGKTDQTHYMLTWIDQIEQAIEQNKSLSEFMKNNGQVDESLEQVLTELNELIGLDEVKRSVREIADWVVFNRLRQEKGFKIDELSLHMVFSGNPGTGKTTVARLIARILKVLGVLKKGHLVEVDRSDLVAEYVGQTAVKTSKKIREAMDGVLFIDEAYSLTRSAHNDFGIEAIDTIVKAMEDKRQKLVIILAGYPNEMDQFLKSNPGLHSRLKNQIDFHDYTVDEMLEISSLMLKQKQFQMTQGAKEILRRIIRWNVVDKPTTHGNGRLVRNILEDAILNKASVAVSDVNKGLKNIDLALIDEEIMRVVEAEVTEVELE